MDSRMIVGNAPDVGTLDRAMEDRAERQRAIHN